MAWIGHIDEVMHYLRTVNADKGEDGRYVISGAQVIVGLDPDEVVVPDETVYFVAGGRKNLAAALRSTSFGLGITLLDGLEPEENPDAAVHLQQAERAIHRGTSSLSIAVGLHAVAAKNRDDDEMEASCAHAYRALGFFNAGLHELGHAHEGGDETFLDLAVTGRRLAEFLLQRGACGPPGIDERYSSASQPEDKEFFAAMREFREALPADWSPENQGDAAALRRALEKVRGISKPRVMNPTSSPNEVLAAIKVWLAQQQLESPSIRFWKPEEWNEKGWKTQISIGFVIITEGTNLGQDLSGDYGEEGQEVYESLSRLLDKHGWGLESITSWAYHVFPTTGKAKLENPASVDFLEKYSPSALEALGTIRSGHFEDLKVEEGGFRWWLTCMTPEDGATFRVSVEEFIPNNGRWEVVHEYGRFGRRAKNPSEAAHRRNFAGAVSAAKRHIVAALNAYDKGDLKRASKFLNDAECDVRQAYIEASYATADASDPALVRMSGELAVIYREIRRLRGHADVQQNPDPGSHLQALATHLQRAEQWIAEAQRYDAARDLANVARIAGFAEAEAMYAKLQLEYLMPHAGKQVPFPGGGQADIPDRAKLDEILERVALAGRTANHLYLNAMCAQPQPWVLRAHGDGGGAGGAGGRGAGGRGMVH